MRIHIGALVVLFLLLASPGARANPQSEVRVNLKAAYVAERAYFQETDRFSQKIGELGFSPVEQHRSERAGPFHPQ